MPFVAVHKKWQDVRPPEAQQRDVWSVANRNQSRFAAAFSRAIRGVVTGEVMRDLRRALMDRDINKAVESFPWFNPADPGSVRLWDNLLQSLRRAVEDVLVETGTEALRNEKIPLALVSKAVGSTPKGGDARSILGLEREFSAAPFSDDWIRTRTGDLIVDVNNGQRVMVREMILDGFQEGLRSETLADRIAQVVGLSPRDARAVFNRRRLLEAQGMPEDQIEQAVERYAKQKLVERGKRIARTELIAAASRGITDSWRIAQEAGFIPADQLREWVAAPSERTCQICGDLDGKQTGLNQPFDSNFLGTVDRPPAHPMCRCTTILV